MKYPLSRYAPSPWKGDDTLGAGRPFLGVSVLGHASFTGCGLRKNAMDQ
jgi:hypothetical protein